LQVWCTEFGKTEDGEQRREPVLRDATNKRRGDKRKEEKVMMEFNALVHN
jgi:dynein heavy chain 1